MAPRPGYSAAVPFRESVIEEVVDAIAGASRVARMVRRSADAPRALAKADASPVTVADYAVQAILVTALHEATGDERLDIVGEESAAVLRDRANAALLDAVVDAVQAWRPGLAAERILDAIDAGGHDATASRFWTIDPIDGTRGFVRGNHYAVCVALIDNGEVVFGGLGCPNLSLDHRAPLDQHPESGTIVIAARGSGCWQRDERAPRERGERLLRGEEPPRAPILAASHASSPSPTGFHSRVLELLGPGADRIRLDSQSKYALVARGQADGYLSGVRDPGGEYIWDHAPGSLVASEAGADVTDLDGKPLDFSRGRRLSANRGLVCAVPWIHERVLRAAVTVMAD